MIEIYGIKNCDTMKKAFRWLADQQLDYDFHDYKKQGLDESLAESWVSELGWEKLVNKRGTTWRKLDDALKDSMDDKLAIDTMVKNTSMIKRPLIVTDNNEVLLGFDAELYQQKLISE